MAALARAAVGDVPPQALPQPDKIYDWVRQTASEDHVILDQGSRVADARSMEAVFHRPYQMHASIGPSCAVGQRAAGAMTVWPHAQGVYPLRKALADMLQLPEDRVRCIHMEGSGCYGHN